MVSRLIDTMVRPAAYVRTVLGYARVFSWGQLALFKLSDLLTSWVNRPALRRARALRLFSYAVPPDALTVEDGEYQFCHQVNERQVEIALRLRSSDIEVFLQVVMNGEYGDAVALLDDVPGPLKVIDAGANVGLTTLYLKCFRPDAHVVAVEPEPGNFLRLSQCVAENRLSNVTLVNEGLWTRDAVLAANRRFRDGEAWSFALAEATDPAEATLPVTSLSSLLARVGWREVDLLKIDIEGGEAALIRDPAFLQVLKERVRLVCMEVHEEVVGRAEVRRALASVGMRCLGGGETLVAWNPAREAGA